MIGFVNAHQASMLGSSGVGEGAERTGEVALEGGREKRRKVWREAGAAADDEPGGAAGGAAEHLGATCTHNLARTQTLRVSRHGCAVGGGELAHACQRLRQIVCQSVWQCV